MKIENFDDFEIRFSWRLRLEGGTSSIIKLSLCVASLIFDVFFVMLRYPAIPLLEVPRNFEFGAAEKVDRLVHQGFLQVLKLYTVFLSEGFVYLKLKNCFAQRCWVKYYAAGGPHEDHFHFWSFTFFSRSWQI